jgi:hypothetical protein
MPISALLHLECVPVEPVDAMKHVAFSCPQSQGANLERLPAIASQRFAVMYDDVMGDHLIEMLERAQSAGALAPVKLIAVLENHLHIFLDASVTSTTFPVIERRWKIVAEENRDWSWTVSFILETEVLTGHSDFQFWDDAKDIFESYSLGIGSLDSSGHNHAMPSNYGDERWDFTKFASERESTLAAGSVPPMASCPDESQDRSSDVPHGPGIDGMFSANSGLLGRTHLMALKKAMHRCPSLRDKCLRAVLMTSARVAEITAIKVQDVRISANRVAVRLNRVEHNNPKHYALSLGVPPALIFRYVQESQLSPGDYLFPSPIRASEPMSNRMVKKAFERWLQDAGMKPDELNVHSLRRTLTLLDRLVTTKAIHNHMIHVSQAMTAYYTATRASEAK